MTAEFFYSIQLATRTSGPKPEQGELLAERQSRRSLPVLGAAFIGQDGARPVLALAKPDADSVFGLDFPTGKYPQLSFPIVISPKRS